MSMTPVRFRLRELRQAKHMTQVELAAASGARQATISDMENGKARRVDLDVLEGLARALDVQVGDLIVLEPQGAEGKGAA